jgi:hypothetical protein
MQLWASLYDNWRVVDRFLIDRPYLISSQIRKVAYNSAKTIKYWFTPINGHPDLLKGLLLDDWFALTDEPLPEKLREVIRGRIAQSAGRR